MTRSRSSPTRWEPGRREAGPVRPSTSRPRPRLLASGTAISPVRTECSRGQPSGRARVAVPHALWLVMELTEALCGPAVGRGGGPRPAARDEGHRGDLTAAAFIPRRRSIVAPDDRCDQWFGSRRVPPGADRGRSTSPGPLAYGQRRAGSRRPSARGALGRRRRTIFDGSALGRGGPGGERAGAKGYHRTPDRVGQRGRCHASSSNRPLAASGPPRNKRSREKSSVPPPHRDLTLTSSSPSSAVTSRRPLRDALKDVRSP